MIASAFFIALAGGIGAAARYEVDRAFLRRHGSPTLPWSTMAINVAGSFVLGLLLGAQQRSAAALWPVLATGLCGGFTTFSTAMLDAVKASQQGRSRSAVTGLAITLLGALLAVSLGWGLVAL